MRGDTGFLVLAVAAALHFAFLSAFLLYPDLNLDYPFQGGDTPDWIANGLRLAGHDVRYSGRPPFLPLVMALLERLGALRTLPLVVEGLFHTTVLAFYRLAARLYPRRAALAAAAFLLVNHSLQAFALEVMADLPASCLLFLSARAFILAGERPRRYLQSGLLAGLSALTQQAGILWAPAAALTVLACRRRDLRSPFLHGGFLLFFLLQGAWTAVKLVAFGSAGDVLARNWQFFYFHTGSIPFYLYAFLSFLGLPACLLLAPGLAGAARRAAAGSAPHLLGLALFASLSVFFVFLYDFNAKRFLVYVIWTAALFLAGALARLPRPLFAAAATILCIGSALPLPGEANDASRIALWPLPPVYARAVLEAAPSGSPSLAAGRPALEPAAFPQVLRASIPYRVWKAHAAWAGTPRTVRLDPRRFAADRTALYLFEKESDGGGRYRTLARLSSALRRPVKVLPADHFEPYWPLLRLTAVGSLTADYSVYRAGLPGLAATWLVVAPGGSSLERRLEGLAAARSGGAAPMTPALSAGRAKAEAILRFIEDSDAYLVMVPFQRRADPSQLYLPFLAETTELVVSERGREEEILRFLAPQPVLAEESFGRTRVRRIRLFDRDSGLISYWPR